MDCILVDATGGTFHNDIFIELPTFLILVFILNDGLYFVGAAWDIVQGDIFTEISNIYISSLTDGLCFMGGRAHEVGSTVIYFIELWTLNTIIISLIDGLFLWMRIGVRYSPRWYFQLPTKVVKNKWFM